LEHQRLNQNRDVVLRYVSLMDHHREFLTDRTQEFGAESCFICGRSIPVGNPLRTEEHVFPKWLLRELNLWDSTVHQLNGERLSYRRLTVPCCQQCNGEDLASVEGRVKTAYEEGYKSFVELSRSDLFIWLGKIYYGIVYKESLRPMFAHEQDGPRLVPESHLETIAFHHFLLQSVAGKVSWTPEQPGPASFHFFECLDDEGNNSSLRFDYLDDLFVPIIALRMGKIGVICVLQDWGRSEGVQQKQLIAARGMALHPTQFREAYARLSYMTKVSWVDRKHMILGLPDSVVVVAGPPGEFAGSFVVEDYARALSAVWEVPFEAIYRDGSTFSTLSDEWGHPTVAHGRNVIFTAPFGRTGLWPGHRIDLGEVEPAPSPESGC
jgi:hypothetical protein